MLPEDRILVVEAESLAIYGIPPLQPMAVGDRAGGDEIEPCVIAVGPQWFYQLPNWHRSHMTRTPVTSEITTTASGERNIIARCAILVPGCLRIFKVSIGAHDYVDVDLVSHSIDTGKDTAGAMGYRRAVWCEDTIDGKNTLKTCTFTITGQNDDTIRLLGNLDGGSGSDACIKFGSIQWVKHHTEDVIDISFDESLGRICVILCCEESYDLDMDTRISLVVMDVV